MRICCLAQGTLLDALWWPKWEGNWNKSGYKYTHGWFTLLYSRNQHNIVKQLNSNKKKIIKKLAEVIIAQKGFIMCSPQSSQLQNGCMKYFFLNREQRLGCGTCFLNRYVEGRSWRVSAYFQTNQSCCFSQDKWSVFYIITANVFYNCHNQNINT